MLLGVVYLRPAISDGCLTPEEGKHSGYTVRENNTPFKRRHKCSYKFPGSGSRTARYRLALFTERLCTFAANQLKPAVAMLKTKTSAKNTNQPPPSLPDVEILAKFKTTHLCLRYPSPNDRLVPSCKPQTPDECKLAAVKCR